MSTTFRALRDSDGNVIDRNLTYARGAVRVVSNSTTSAGSSTAFSAGVQYVEFLSSNFVNLKLTPSSSLATAVLNTDMPLAAGDRLIVPVGSAKYFGVIAASGTGVTYATEL